MQANLVVRAGASADRARAVRRRQPDDRRDARRRRRPARPRSRSPTRSSSSARRSRPRRRSTPRRCACRRRRAKLGDALALMADVALTPDFPAAELERAAHRAPDRAAAGARRPGRRSRASRSRACSSGREHRYGTSAGGTEPSLKAIGVADLKDAPSQPLPARQRRAHRGGRRDAGGAACRCVEQRASAGGRPTDRPPRRSRCARRRSRGKRADLPRRQAGRRAVADPHRPGRRAALDARLRRRSTC